MGNVFIISEYNPFHTGHAWHIGRIRQELAPDAVIAVMSGNFVQRGSPAILDKFNRARLAIEAGCDLVVELPCVYATSSAEFFARGGVAITQGLDPSGTLSFGSECGNLSGIVSTARILLQCRTELDTLIQKGLGQGWNFPRARAEAFRELTGDSALADLLAHPNNILGVEYVRAALNMGSSLSFHTVRRQGLGYHDKGDSAAGDLPTAALPSATALRRALSEGDLAYVRAGIPSEIQALFESLIREGLLLKEDELKKLVQYRLELFPSALLTLPEARDGLGQRVLKHSAALAQLSLTDFALLVKTRRFTYTRIRRLLLHLALGFDELDYEARRRKAPAYARILALNEKGQRFLRQTRNSRSISLVQTARDIPEDIFRPDRNASRLYSLLNPSWPAAADFTQGLKVQT